MPDKGIHPAIPVAAGVGLILVAGGLYLGRKKPPPRPPPGIFALVGLPTAMVNLVSGGTLMLVGLPTAMVNLV